MGFCMDGMSGYWWLYFHRSFVRFQKQMYSQMCIQLFKADRFREVIRRTGFNGRLSGCVIHNGGDHDNGHLRMQVSDLFQNLNTIHPRHPYVQKHHVRTE